MKIKLFLLFILITSFAFSQKTVETIQSKKLGEERSFTVSLPVNYEFDTDKKYPILVLLDGEYLLSPFEGIVKYGNYWDDLPEMIIVAVNQNYGETRFNDSEFDSNGLPSGKGASFFEFIGFELLPYLESKFRTQPFRIIAGHDTTAGFLNFYLYKDNPIFNGYISLAPEMAPEMEKRISERLAIIKKPLFYYQATGEGDIKEINDGAKALDNNINALQNKTFKYRFDEFKGASHYSLVAQAIPQALYFIFDGYQPISMVEFQEKIVTLDKGYTQYLIDKYTNLEQNLGLKIQPRLTDFKAIEAAILKNKAYLELQDLGKYADKQYPKTTLGTFHQALYYEKVGEYKKAIKEYRKAYTLTDIRELTKSYMLDRAESLKDKKDESTVEELAEPTSEEGEKKDGE
ncbi:alpha/beta hydrolase [Flavobacterium sediminilitoris]|uniref:Alpha/beta hydrolase n=1 Tax=Flavobacterium sediminilitoris TaxID=2024526 RepID=A0ABY4HQJ7_9FLAO|nr:MULTISPECIES: alpha/beta hydrolase-fold protein [Flavobacterium]UOX35143.1 alpha/beta hydrolase [Flavobacterium sediminilitoris]